MDRYINRETTKNTDEYCESGESLQIQSCFDKEMSATIIQNFSRWFYQAGIPFNIVILKSFKVAWESMNTEIKPLTYHKVSDTCLKL